MVDKKVAHFERKFEKIAKFSIKLKRYELALSAINAWAMLLDKYSQKFSEKRLEDIINELAILLKTDRNNSRGTSEKVILFYDGYGYDQRGLALIYLKALGELGYKVIYVTKDEVKELQPITKSVCSEYDVEWKYIKFLSHREYINNIIELFELYTPSTIFIHTTLHDTDASVAFTMLRGKANRFWINLTDHAFWVGKNSFDYCIEFRSLGASFSVNERKIEREKLKLLPFYPNIDEKIEFRGFPFEKEGMDVIISGGAIDKTLGDTSYPYYRIIDTILQYRSNLVFYYIGNGDTTKLEELQKKYPNRVFFSSERRDFFQCIQNSTLYFNTYPVNGTLMTQYAMRAGKIPVTLYSEEDSFEGLILNGREKDFTFYSEKEIIRMTNELLKNSKLREENETRIKQGIISQAEFNKQLDKLIKYKHNDFNVELLNKPAQKIKKQFREQFNLKKEIHWALFEKDNKPLWKCFPLVCSLHVIDVIYEKILVLLEYRKSM